MQLVPHLDVLDLEVRDRGLVERAPVDDAVVPVDPASLPEVDEERHHGAHVVLVHREPLARVVERGPEPPELAHDRPPGLVQPVPGAEDEGLAAEVVPRQALLRELALDDVLRRDTGVVVAGLPERVVALHPMPADEHVLERPVERMAHVQVARDVRRWDADDVRAVATRAGAGRVQAFLLPALLPAFLDAFGAVQGLHRRGV